MHDPILISGRAPIRCGEEVLAAAMAQERVVTREFATVWVQRGPVVHVDGDGAVHRLGDGDAFCRFPGVVHGARFGAGARMLWVALPPASLDLLRQLGPAARRPVFRPGAHPDLARRWRLAARDCSRCAPGRMAALGGRLFELMADLHLRSPRADAPGRAALERAAAQLADAESPRLRLTALARQAGMSYRSFRRAFAAYAGLAPEAYRIRCRIAAAQDLLRDGIAVAAIADRLGYRDVADFSRQFARVVGCSPRAWRRLDPSIGAGA